MSKQVFGDLSQQRLTGGRAVVGQDRDADLLLEVHGDEHRGCGHLRSARNQATSLTRYGVLPSRTTHHEPSNPSNAA